MTLDEYLEKLTHKDGRKVTDAEFGAWVGLSQSQISRLRSGASNPSLATIEKIATASNGKVKPNDWLTPRKKAVA